MAYLSEQAAYLRGLAEGLELSEQSSEGKILVKIIDALEEFAAAIEDNSEVLAECEERVDSLEDFADDFMEAMHECGCEHDDCDCDDCDCDDCDCDDEFCDEEEFYELECPHCNEKVYFDEDMLDNDLVCPNCDGKIEIEIDD